VRKADNLTTILCLVMKYGNLKFLEPSGPLQACNGTALRFLNNNNNNNNNSFTFLNNDDDDNNNNNNKNNVNGNMAHDTDTKLQVDIKLTLLTNQPTEQLHGAEPYLKS
jgi:hypothetical protein